MKTKNFHDEIELPSETSEEARWERIFFNCITFEKDREGNVYLTSWMNNLPKVLAKISADRISFSDISNSYLSE